MNKFLTALVHNYNSSHTTFTLKESGYNLSK